MVFFIDFSINSIDNSLFVDVKLFHVNFGSVGLIDGLYLNVRIFLMESGDNEIELDFSTT